MKRTTIMTDEDTLLELKAIAQRQSKSTSQVIREALAGRLKVTRVLTLDRRHIELFRPRHCAAFEILP